MQLLRRATQRSEHEILEQGDIVGIDRLGIDRHGSEIDVPVDFNGDEATAGAALHHLVGCGLHAGHHLLRGLEQAPEVHTAERVTGRGVGLVAHGSSVDSLV